jgi:metal-sulfur cluster biosynthetic enzyme
MCARAIELHRENLSRVAAQSASGGSAGTTLSLVPVTMVMVTRAAAEYRENPLMTATAHACNLDKAILIGMCKYAKSTGVSEMQIEEIWRRTTDAVSAYGQRAAGGRLEMPPWAVFEQALHRLVSEGLLVLVVNRYRKSGGGRSSSVTGAMSTRPWNIDDALFEPRLIHSDILAALRDVKDPMCSAAWPNSS